jgi:hypothetical protein
MQEQDRIWTLMARKLAGEATREEGKELDKFQHKYPDMTCAVEMLLGFWAQENQPDQEEAEEAFDRLMQRMAAQSAGKLPYKLSRNIPATSITSRITWKKKASWCARLYTAFANSGSILSHYLKTTFRNFLRNRTFSLINIIGLAVGMAGMILLITILTVTARH